MSELYLMVQNQVQTVQTKSKVLNLEAAVLVCARCARVQGVLGAVVAGRFWCSYAWVSLTQTAPVRPRAPVLERACACVRV